MDGLGCGFCDGRRRRRRIVVDGRSRIAVADGGDQIDLPVRDEI
jgi:hypothetical protein